MMTTRIRSIGRVLLAGLLALALLPSLLMAQTAPGGQNFDHLTTGFALVGAHQTARCESCHVRGVMRGTSRVCASCHVIVARTVGAPRPPTTHGPPTQTFAH